MSNSELVDLALTVGNRGYGVFKTKAPRKSFYTIRFYYVPIDLERPRSLADSHVHPSTAYTQVRANKRRPRATGTFARRARTLVSFGGEIPLPCRNSVFIELRSTSST